MCVSFRFGRTEDTRRGPVRFVLVRGRTDALRWRLNPNRILQLYRAVESSLIGYAHYAQAELRSSTEFDRAGFVPIALPSDV